MDFEKELINIIHEYFKDEYNVKNDQERNNKRKKVNTEKISPLINEFLANNIGLDEFKSRIDGLNKKYKLWGYSGIAGAMFFNLVRSTGEDVKKLEQNLKNYLLVPKDFNEAKLKIQSFADYIKRLGEHVEDKYKKPAPKSSIFFLSYYWHIQAPAIFPIFYPNSRNALNNLTSFNENLIKDYGEMYLKYCSIIKQIQESYVKNENQQFTLNEISNILNWYMTVFLDQAKRIEIEANKKDIENQPIIVDSENWEKKFIDEEEAEIDELNKEKASLIESLKIAEDPSDIYQIYWRMKEIYSKLKLKYKLLGYWTHIDYTTKSDEYLQSEVLYFEKCLHMLKEKHGVDRIDLRHYLMAAELEYEYFIIKKNTVPKLFLTQFDIKEITSNFGYNIIINNIKNAQKNLQFILKYKVRTNNNKELFLYNEIMGDLYIHIYLLLDLLPDKLEDTLRKWLKFAYLYYLIALRHKEIVEQENPTTYIDGLHGWPCLPIFVEFFKENGILNVHDLKSKIRILQKKVLTGSEISEITDKYKVTKLEY